MAVETYTKSGAKAAAPAKLDKTVFGLTVGNHQLLKDAYLAYMAGGRQNLARAKSRGEVAGGGQKPWRQKGTGRARFGSSRNPIWRGGGAAFGPTGGENFSRKLTPKAKRQALRQALSLAATEGRVKVVEKFDFNGKAKGAAKLLDKTGSHGRALLVLAEGGGDSALAVRNIDRLKARSVSAKYLTVYHLMNADTILIEKPALEIIHAWLGGKK